ncbi:hypothetical protein PUN28_001067 [Cardiocondyla obscurior]|uniref:Uncharacterized protein n=1 Tax=Cardiocondyla obscurior TaxID=286306 RepID=A0AAW2H2T5_9HYME
MGNCRAGRSFSKSFMGRILKVLEDGGASRGPGASEQVGRRPGVVHVKRDAGLICTIGLQITIRIYYLVRTSYVGHGWSHKVGRLLQPLSGRWQNTQPPSRFSPPSTFLYSLRACTYIHRRGHSSRCTHPPSAPVSVPSFARQPRRRT